MTDRSPFRLRRSCLVVPGSSPKMLAKATTLAADQLILDLEDGVAADAKVEARARIVEALASHDFGGRTVTVRINALATPWGADDLAALVESAVRPDTVIVPKVSDVADVATADEAVAAIGGRPTRDGAPPTGIEILIEDAVGLRDIDTILTASPRVEACIVGPGDLAAALGMPGTTIGVVDDAVFDPWGPLLSAMLVAARAAGVAMIDGPYARIGDEEGLAASIARTRGMGYDGKWVIHPSQIEPVTAAYGITQEAFEYACDLLDAYEVATTAGTGAVVFDGEMVDAATRAMAERQRERGQAEGRTVRPTPDEVGPAERAAWRASNA